ncbi:hypothetical protein EVAR_60650_1 [Eumeta japonica]|uniref:Uncharacterized protein n=1 Tax=Eumeta variegata TaxID=151549 RepID=A0A4C1ZNS8_EUMVA|nr:hypothetical protein EVAR_60650_1 [Eumeta japonica]
MSQSVAASVVADTQSTGPGGSRDTAGLRSAQKTQAWKFVERERWERSSGGVRLAARSARLGVAQRDRTPAHQYHQVSRECEFEYHRKHLRHKPSRSPPTPSGANAGRPVCVCAAEHARRALHRASRAAPRTGLRNICDYPQFIETPDIHHRIKADVATF